MLIKGIVELINEEGNATSTGFAQAEAVYMKVMEWGTEGKIVALVFDTTASNKGHIRGAAIRNKIKFGYPAFPKMSDKTELPDLVTSDSWQMFDILKLSPDWLALPPDEWDTDPDYIVFRNFVRTVKVTNDCAERGVKLATDYSKSLTKDSQERSKIYQVVEAERRAKPDAKKSTLNK